MDRSWAEPGVRIIAVLATHERKHDRNTAEGLSSLSTAVAHPLTPVSKWAALGALQPWCAVASGMPGAASCRAKGSRLGQRA